MSSQNVHFGDKQKTAQKGWYLVVVVAAATVPASHMVVIASFSEQHLQPSVWGVNTESGLFG